MKQIFFLLVLMISFTILNAQTVKKPVVKTNSTVQPASLKTLFDSVNYAMGMGFANYCKQQGKTNVNTSLVLKAIDDVFGTNKTDSSSYALGLSFASFYKQQGITSINKTLISKGINDVLGSKKQQISDAMANSVMNNYVTILQSQKSKPNIEAGLKFLEQNKSKPGIRITASGIQYEVLTEGAGPKPTAEDSVTCNYKGELLNGTEIDNSYKRGAPITFSLHGVIPGWTEGLQLMNVGSKYRFFIPYNLAYGAFDYMEIPGGSMLTFEIELLDIKKVVAVPAK